MWKCGRSRKRRSRKRRRRKKGIGRREMRKTRKGGEEKE